VPKIDFGWGAPSQTLLRELTALPQNPSWNKGDLLLRKVEGCREGKGKTDRGGKGKGGEGKEKAREKRGREWRDPVCICKFF